MKRILFLLLSITISGVMHAQEEGVTLDLLKAPSSPAANLLGFATSDIEKPTDISSLMLSLQSATNSFNTLPSNYAIDLAPYFLLGKPGFTTTALNETGFSSVFRQTLVLSFAIRNTDSTFDNFQAGNTYAGLGFKFSILRPEYDAQTKAVLHNIHTFQGMINKVNLAALQQWKNTTDPEVLVLRRMRADIFAENPADKIAAMQADSSSELNRIERKLAARLQNFTESDSAEYKQGLLNKIQAEAAKFKGIRSGFSLDLAGGFGGEFQNTKFDDSRIFNAGIWTTFGYTGEKGGSLLGLVRYLHNPDRVFAKDNAPREVADISTLDAGLRAVYSREASRFNASLEAVYRSALTDNTIDPSWRLIFNADYSLFKNQKLTFSFGRNFDGTTTKDGNLVAALTFLTGFGNKR